MDIVDSLPRHNGLFELVDQLADNAFRDVGCCCWSKFESLEVSLQDWKGITGIVI